MIKWAARGLSVLSGQTNFIILKYTESDYSKENITWIEKIIKKTKKTYITGGKQQSNEKSLWSLSPFIPKK